MHYYHPVGTCAMGSVVNENGAVIGAENLYVADCSIIPTIPRANTNVPAAVIGLRVAEALLGVALARWVRYEIHAPSYLYLLEAEDEPSGKRPPDTYKRASDGDYARAMTRYWLALQDLEDSGIRTHEVAPKLLAKLLADGPHADVLIKVLVKDADRYRRSPARRHAILHRVLAGLPASGGARGDRAQPRLGRGP